MTYRLRTAFVFCFVFLVLGAGVLPAAAQAQQYIVTFEKGTPREIKGAAAARHGAVVHFNYDIVDAVAVTVPNERALRALTQEANVRSFSPDYPVFATQSSHASDNARASKGKPGGGSDAPIPTQTVPPGVQRVGVPKSGSDGAGIGVAIADTGIDLNPNRDLAPVAGSFNAVNPGSSCQDDNGHGTHVAGIVAALDNSIDVVGVAPAATLYCVKVLNSQGSGSWSTVIAGLQWIYDTNGGEKPTTPLKIGVVNMSLSGPAGSPSDTSLKDAIKKLHDTGVVIVVAAGNEASSEVEDLVPGAYSRDHLVLTVASTTAVSGNSACPNLVVAADTASFFTTDGVDVTVSAPGEEKEDVSKRGNACYLTSLGILSLKLGGGTTRMSGTSMASPHVAGIVARLLQGPDNHTPDTIELYFKDRNRGADGMGCLPIKSPAASATDDLIREGIAIIKAPTVSCSGS